MANKKPLVITTSRVSELDGGSDTLAVGGPITATTYGGITEANLVDKAAAEAITGSWDFGGATDLEVPNGAGGHAALDTTGQVTVDTTSDTFNFHTGAEEAVLNPSRAVTISVEDPTATEDITIGFWNSAITITEMRAVLLGSSTPSVTWTVRHGTDRNATGAEVVTSGTTTTSTTTGSDVTSFNDATIVADSFIWLETTAQSGTVDEIHITIVYDQDA